MKKFSLFLLLLLLPALAVSQSMHNLAALENAALRQNDWAGHRVWVHGSTPGGNGTSRASGVILDPWNVLVAGHQVFSNSFGGYAFDIVVGRGSNYNSEPGNVFSVSNYEVHPGWTGGNTFGNTVDMAILHLATPIPGVSSLNIAPSQMGQQLVAVGYGRPATPGSGYLPIDGQARAFNMYVDQFGTSGGTISQDYLVSLFMPTFMRSDSLAGGGTPGNSGSGVFNATGDLVGLAVGIGGSAPGYGYATAALRIDLFQNWILTNMKVPTPPRPISISHAEVVHSFCLRPHRPWPAKEC